MSRVRNVTLSYWLTICVLLFYQQTADMVLSMEVGVGVIEGEFGPEIDPLDPHCSDWEVFNGVDCVCADDVSARCTGQGGMVCDNTGSQYKSACAFALDTCSEKIPQDRTIETCGFCTRLNLVAGQDSRVVTTFTKTSVQTGGTDVEYMYVSHTDHLVLFYSADLGAWAVERLGEDDSVIAMRLVKSSAYPQDNRWGMLVATQQGDKIDWQIDPFMHFECVQTHPEIHTPNAYRYHDVGMDIRGATSLLFEVTACNDAHVLLMTNPGDENQDVIEIVIDQEMAVSYINLVIKVLMVIILLTLVAAVVPSLD